MIRKKNYFFEFKYIMISMNHRLLQKVIDYPQNIISIVICIFNHVTVVRNRIISEENDSLDYFYFHHNGACIKGTLCC